MGSTTAGEDRKILDVLSGSRLRITITDSTAPEFATDSFQPGSFRRWPPPKPGPGQAMRAEATRATGAQRETCTPCSPRSRASSVTVPIAAGFGVPRNPWTLLGGSIATQQVHDLRGFGDESAPYMSSSSLTIVAAWAR
jgi:hypothetical protein